MTGARLAAGPGRWFGAVGRAVRQCAGRIADILRPPRCVACHGWLADHNTLCATCWGGVDFIRAPLCDRLGIPLPFDPGGRSISAAAAARPPTYDRARAAARYAGVVQQLVVRFKYGDQHDVLQSGLLPDPFRDLIAVQAWQADVQEHHVR